MKANRKLRSSRRAGFTLIEVLVVVLIIGLLVGLVGTNVFSALISGQKGAVKAQIKQFEAAIKLYRLENSMKYPDSLEQLLEPSPVSGESYFDAKSIPNDPWDNPYEYIVNDDSSYTITCFGKDGQPGGEGDNEDISNETLAEEG